MTARRERTGRFPLLIWLIDASVRFWRNSACDEFGKLKGGAAVRTLRQRAQTRPIRDSLSGEDHVPSHVAAGLPTRFCMSETMACSSN